MHAWTGKTAYALVERARKAGWKDGAILDELAVTESGVRLWKRDGKTEPHRSTAERLAKFEAMLDRAERRKGAGK